MTMGGFAFGGYSLQRGNDPFVRAKVSTLSSEQSSLESKVNSLEKDVYRMALFVQTLINALIESQTVSPERLKEIMHEIDLSDGDSDGRFDHTKDLGYIEKTGVECPRCARLNRRDRSTCLYCGEPLPEAGEWLNVPE